MLWALVPSRGPKIQHEEEIEVFSSTVRRVVIHHCHGHSYIVLKKYLPEPSQFLRPKLNNINVIQLCRNGCSREAPLRALASFEHSRFHVYIYLMQLTYVSIHVGPRGLRSLNRQWRTTSLLLDESLKSSCYKSSLHCYT